MDVSREPDAQVDKKHADVNKNNENKNKQHKSRHSLMVNRLMRNNIVHKIHAALKALQSAF